MKFVKLKLRDIGGKFITQWQMVIDNIDDLERYHELDGYLNARALIDLPKTKAAQHIDNPRMAAINQLLEIASYSEEKKYPIIEVAKLTDQKYLGMAKTINLYGAIRINKGGGYCGLKSYMETWNAEIIETIEKDDLGFPIDEEVINCDTLVLENSFYREDFSDYAANNLKKHIENVGVIGFIGGLKAIDKNYIYKAILNSKNIYINSQLLDDEQLDEFMQLFSKTPRKNIYLDIYSKGITKLKEHKLFEANNNIHNILFINKY